MSDTYWFQKFDLVIVQWRKKTRIQISKITKTSREKLKELAWWSYDEKDTVSSVKKARAGEQQQLNIERIKSEIITANERLAEERKERVVITNNIWDENAFIEDLEDDKMWIDWEEITQDYEAVDENNNITDDEMLPEKFNNWETDVVDKVPEPLSAWNGDVVVDTKRDINEPQSNDTYTITSDNLSFSKMKQMMTIISWNPWEFKIDVLWNEMNVSQKWLDELNKLITE